MDVASLERARGGLLQAGLDLLEQGLTVVDGDLRLVAWNRRFAELLDLPRPMLQVGMPFEEVLRFNAERGEYGRGEVAALVADRLRTARRFAPHRIERTRPNGIILLIEGTPLAGGGFVTVYTDVTERRRAEAVIRAHSDLLELHVRERTAELSAVNEQLRTSLAELQKAEAALRDARKMAAIGQLAGGLAHDFNNLLTVVIGNLHSLKSQVDPDLAEAYVEPAIRAGHRGIDITRRLLAFARRQPLDPQPVDVEQIMTRTVRLLRGALPGSIAIECSADVGLWPALVDANQLESALVNLALNARDAMPNGGRLALQASNSCLAADDTFAGHPVDGEYVRISVSDTGSGIDRATLSRAFEPFFTTKPFGMGSGLGLSMVYGFVKQSGGHINIESEPGRGTCVSFLLPRAASPATAAAAVAEARPHARGRGQLVLLVEDDDRVRLAVRRELLELGYKVIEARDGAEAGQLLQAVADIGVLVTEVAMRGGAGRIALAELARQTRANVHVVLISGFVHAETREIRRIDGVVFVGKPVDREQLKRAIEGWEQVPEPARA